MVQFKHASGLRETRWMEKEGERTGEVIRQVGERRIEQRFMLWVRKERGDFPI